MRTIPIPALMLSLLAPVLALTQAGQGPNTPNQAVTSSPLFWYWVVALAIAAVVVIWATFVISRRRGGPPSTPRIS